MNFSNNVINNMTATASDLNMKSSDDTSPPSLLQKPCYHHPAIVSGNGPIDLEAVKGLIKEDCTDGVQGVEVRFATADDWNGSTRQELQQQIKVHSSSGFFARMVLQPDRTRKLVVAPISGIEGCRPEFTDGTSTSS